MIHAIAAAISVWLLLSPSPAMQADLAGGWQVELTVPAGELVFRMWIVQKGARLSGHMLNEVGQFDLQGSVSGDEVKLLWSIPDGGRLVPITFTGKAEKDSISGIARLDGIGEGAMYAQRGVR
jgi:hypothetical protein